MNSNKILKTNEDIKEDLKLLASKINNDYRNTECLEIICFLNGATFFCSDLARLLEVPNNINFFGFSSYEDLPKNGEVKIEQDLKKSIYKKDVLLLEGLTISGRTPFYLYNFFQSRNPRTLKFCTLGVKTAYLKVDLKIDYHIYEFENEWVEGYGIGKGSNKSLQNLVDVRSSS